MTTRSITRTLVVCMAATLALASAGSHQAKADGIITANPGLPPQDAIGGYAGYEAQLHATFDLPPADGGGTIVLSNISHNGFSNIMLSQGTGPGGPGRSRTSTPGSAAMRPILPVVAWCPRPPSHSLGPWR